MKRSESDLIGRAVVDTGFRARLLKDPEGVISAEGYEVGSEMRGRLKEAASSSPDAIDAAIAAAAREGGVGG